MNIAVSVILYHPDESVYDNICSYASYFGRIFVVNNGGGEQVINKLLSEYGKDKLEIIDFPDNQGIAKPLNVVLGKCAQQGYEYLMTMDQDSKFLDKGIRRYLKEAQQHSWIDTLGISAFSNIEDGAKESFQHIEVPGAITSGNIISVEHALKIGGFEEKLFIDEVDFEFCYRGQLKGYKSYQISGIEMQHTIGNPVSKKLLWLKWTPTNHGRVRKYYVTRNKLWVYKKYHKQLVAVSFYSYIVKLIAMLAKTILYESDKARKLQYMWMGLRDFYSKNMGKMI